MRLIVLDTNVIVSAGIKPNSPPYRLIHSFVLEDRVRIVLCPSIVAEYREVSTRSKFAQYGFPPAWLEIMIADGLGLPEPQPWPHPLPDADDGCFLALAKISGAWLITGNAKHCPPSARNGVVVKSPGDYLAFIEPR
jgi:putative PIN family toxin of toxin-antitoxin system